MSTSDDEATRAAIRDLSAEGMIDGAAAAGVDDATWARGRGWALCLGLGSEHYYCVTNPALATVGRRAMFEVLADYRSSG